MYGSRARRPQTTNWHTPPVSPKKPGTVWVGSLPESVDDSDLRRHFDAYDEDDILSVRVQRDACGKSRCFGFVNFSDESMAIAARKTYNGTLLNGKRIKVNVKGTNSSSLSASPGRQSSDEMLKLSFELKTTVECSYDSDEEKLALRTFIKRHWTDLVAMGKDRRVFVTRGKDGCSLSLQGTADACKAYEVNLDLRLRQQRQHLSTERFSLNSLLSSSLATAEMNAAASKLQQEHCVAISWPGKEEGLICEEKFDSGSTLQLTRHPIFLLDVDAVIAPATGDLSHVKGLCKGIAKSEGQRITKVTEDHFDMHGLLQPGEVKSFPVYNLKCKEVVYAVAPECSGSVTENDRVQLRDAVTNGLRCAERSGASSVAMPAIGDGIFGFPDGECARIMLDAVRSHCAKSSFLSVIVSLINPGLIDAFQTELERQNDEINTAKQEKLPVASWSFENDHKSFQAYSKEEISALEREYQRNPKGFCLLEAKASLKNHTYLVSFQNMTQMNVSTSKVRPVKRQISKPSQGRRVPFRERLRGSAIGRGEMSVTVRGEERDVRAATARFQAVINENLVQKTVAYSKHLRQEMTVVIKQTKTHYNLKVVGEADEGNKSVVVLEGVRFYLAEAVKIVQDEIYELQNESVGLEAIPPEWTSQDENLELKRLISGEEGYKTIKSLIKVTLPGAKIKRIDRIQNKWLWKRFVNHREEMKMKNKGEINEMDLFHGTRDTPPEKIYGSEEGFDMRYSNKGLWGQGNYFAVNASYSHMYSYKMQPAYRQFLLARVLTGDSATVVNDRSLRMPPLKDASSGGLFEGTRHDTVTGFTNGSRVYVTYKNDKAYPLYLITYSM